MNFSNALPADIHDIKPPVPVPSYGPWIWGVLLALAVAALAYWLWRRRRRPSAATVSIPPPPAHVIARQRLQRALELIDQPRPFCIEVSDALREYLEKRFDFHAPERTTEEFLEELQSSALLSLDQKYALGEFLQRCDLVKFARYLPERSELAALHETAVNLVAQTQPSAQAAGAHAPAA